MSNIFKITLPDLGIITYANGIEDIYSAIDEAVECFAISAERYGKGLEEELKACIKNDTNHEQ